MRGIAAKPNLAAPLSGLPRPAPLRLHEPLSHLILLSPPSPEKNQRKLKRLAMLRARASRARIKARLTAEEVAERRRAGTAQKAAQRAAAREKVMREAEAEGLDPSLLLLWPERKHK